MEIIYYPAPPDGRYPLLLQNWGRGVTRDDRYQHTWELYPRQSAILAMVAFDGVLSTLHVSEGVFIATSLLWICICLRTQDVHKWNPTM